MPIQGNRQTFLLYKQTHCCTALWENPRQMCILYQQTIQWSHLLFILWILTVPTSQYMLQKTYMKITTNNSQVTLVCICHSRKGSSWQSPDLSKCYPLLKQSLVCCDHDSTKSNTFVSVSQYLAAAYKGSFAPAASGGDGGNSCAKGLLEKQK